MEVERLWGMYTKFRGIPRRCFPAVFHYGEEHELGKIHQAINNITSVKDFGQTASACPRTNRTHYDKWGDPVTHLLSDFVAALMCERIRLY